MTRRRARDARRGLCLRRANANFVGGARAREWARPGWGFSHGSRRLPTRDCACAPGPVCRRRPVGTLTVLPKWHVWPLFSPVVCVGWKRGTAPAACAGVCVGAACGTRWPQSSQRARWSAWALGPSPTDAEKAERSGLSRRALTNGGRVVVLWAGHAPWWGQWEAPAGAPTCVGSSIEQSTAGGTKDGGKTVVPAIASAQIRRQKGEKPQGGGHWTATSRAEHHNHNMERRLADLQAREERMPVGRMSGE